MTPEEKVAILKEAGVWDVIGYPTCIDKLFDLVAAHERERTKDLTDDEIYECYTSDAHENTPRSFARAVIAADRSKNNG